MNNIYSAMKALIEKDGKYLILESTYGNNKIKYFDLPWGRIQEWENPFETLQREILEEVALEVEIIKSLGLWWFDRIDDKRVICHTFLCSISSQKYIDIWKNPDNIEDIIAFHWLSKEELIQSKLFQNISIQEIFHQLP